ncbi:MAG: cytochrome P450, partial [Rhodobacteraceae bacterium]|nr:cytochrome P450 [Paracoccaceae bacterium]
MQHLSQSPTDPGFVQNPYPFYDHARAQGAFFVWEDYGMVCATSFSVVDAALRSRKLGREIPAELRTEPPEHIRPFMEFESRSLLELEPPAHTRLRAPITRAFTSRRIAGLAPDIAALAHQLIDRFPDQPFDLLPAFAEKIPVIIIARLLGVPEDMADQFLAWSHDMVAMYQANRSAATEAAAVVATLAFSDYMRAHIAHRRTHPGDDLITTLLAAEQDGTGLTGDEVITTAILLLNAGHEATVHVIGNGVRALLHSGLPVAPLMAADRVAATVEETLRFDPPLHMFTR